jgi:hypothetical protein
VPWAVPLVTLPVVPPAGLPLWAGSAAGLLAAGPLPLVGLSLLAGLPLVVTVARLARPPARSGSGSPPSSSSPPRSSGTSARHWHEERRS